MFRILVHHSVSIEVLLALLTGVEDKVGVLVTGGVIDELHKADFFSALNMELNGTKVA